MKIEGNIVDIQNKEIFFGVVEIEEKRIKSITKKEGKSDVYILPGFVDAHIHIESSMLVPSAFAQIAVIHGTVATVSDPHEIANVLGIEGVEFMIENGKKVPFKFYFGAPSCVPATTFESAGAVLDDKAVQVLLEKPEIKYLAEMMNFPGVIFHDEQVMAKLTIAKMLNKPVDGHAPGLSGDDLKKYASSGITTDHECFTIDEALEKIELGMKILIREGSAAKNFETLIPLIENYSDEIMLCSDDKHPDNLIEGHINQLVVSALQKGYDLFDILKVACVNPVAHYNLDVGLLQEGDYADFIIVDDLKKFDIKATYINGVKVAENKKSLINSVQVKKINNFNTGLKVENDFQIKAKGDRVKTIEVIDGELITKSIIAKAKIESEYAISDISNDILKISVINRYKDEKPAVAFVKNFNLKYGAIASSVAHDSHNIIAVGTDDKLLLKAVNLIIENKGGISAVSGKQEKVLPLPIAGLMTDDDGIKTGKKYSEIDEFVKKELGSNLKAPFMTLAFMALLVIPELKLSDKGLFDGTTFSFTDAFVK